MTALEKKVSSLANRMFKDNETGIDLRGFGLSFRLTTQTGFKGRCVTITGESVVITDSEDPEGYCMDFNNIQPKDLDRIYIILTELQKFASSTKKIIKDLDLSK